MEQKKSTKMTRADRVKYLLNTLNKWIKEGCPPADAIEKLSIKQYDFLIDNGIDLDNLILTDEQQKTIKEVLKSPRPLFEKGYNKANYPDGRKNAFAEMLNGIHKAGGEIYPKDKENFRHIDFYIDGQLYNVIVSKTTPKGVTSKTDHFQEWYSSIAE